MKARSYHRVLAGVAMAFQLAACSVGNRYGDPDVEISRQVDVIRDYQRGRGNVVDCLGAEATLAEWSVNSGRDQSINAARQAGDCTSSPNFRRDFGAAEAAGKFIPLGYNSYVDEGRKAAEKIGAYGLEKYYQDLKRRGPAR